jgi:glycosyltransferase involved in cell wall biosynthesis
MVTQPPDIIYVGEFHFPEQDAGGSRVLGIGRALRASGLSVAFVGMEPSGRPEDRQAPGQYCFDEFAYLSESNMDSHLPRHLRRLALTHLTGGTTFQRLKEIDMSRVKAIIAYHGMAPFLWQMRRYCRQRGIALIADCTEWYDPTHLTFGRLGPLHLDSELRMRWILPRIGRVVAISSYLTEYFRLRRCRVVCVPPLLDVQKVTAITDVKRSWKNDPLQLVYTGVPGRKDLIANVVQALARINSRSSRVILNLVGPSYDTLRFHLGDDGGLLSQMADTIVCHGRLSRAHAMQFVSAADFSVLVRPSLRFAQAGFPTKIPESLAVGTPVICNLTSDLGEYIHNGVEGLVCHDHSPDAIADAIERALSMTPMQFSEMRQAARAQAECSFDYRVFVEPLRAFLEDLQ